MAWFGFNDIVEVKKTIKASDGKWITYRGRHIHIGSTGTPIHFDLDRYTINQVKQTVTLTKSIRDEIDRVIKGKKVDPNTTPMRHIFGALSESTKKKINQSYQSEYDRPKNPSTLHQNEFERMLDKNVEDKKQEKKDSKFNPKKVSSIEALMPKIIDAHREFDTYEDKSTGQEVSINQGVDIDEFFRGNTRNN